MTSWWYDKLGLGNIVLYLNKLYQPWNIIWLIWYKEIWECKVRCYEWRKIRHEMGLIDREVFHQIPLDVPCASCFYFMKSCLEVEDREKTNIHWALIQMCHLLGEEVHDWTVNCLTAGFDFYLHWVHTWCLMYTPDTVLNLYYLYASHFPFGVSAFWGQRPHLFYL